MTMWNRFFRQVVGRQMTDLDGPDNGAMTTRILTASMVRDGDQEFVTLHGQAFDWRCDLRYLSALLLHEDGTIHLRGLCGMHLRIEAP